MRELDTDEIRVAVDSALAAARTLSGGENASYIPFLATVDPDLCALAVVTADGRTVAAGDSDVPFALESISKVFTMALAMEECGPDAFHRQIGADATGMAFNSIMAMEVNDDQPVSPMVNAGAISSTSLVRAENKEQRWRRILGMQCAFAGTPVVLNEELNRSEQSTNYHNRAIAWLLKCGGAIYSDPMDACEVYTRQCSTLVTTTQLATMGATLAAGGINPLSGERVVSAKNVPHLLAEMTMEGLYTASGDWAYTVGVPGKSGVGGGVLAVVPGTLAIAGFSPPLDTAGNSVRAQAAIASVVASLDLGLYG